MVLQTDINRDHQQTTKSVNNGNRLTPAMKYAINSNFHRHTAWCNNDQHPPGVLKQRHFIETDQIAMDTTNESHIDIEFLCSGTVSPAEFLVLLQ